MKRSGRRSQGRWGGTPVRQQLRKQGEQLVKGTGETGAKIGRTYPDQRQSRIRRRR
jgi:hypothetical protein